ncbi:MAG: hypothetical protein IJK61_04605 [Bacteroidetes bacterium]|nr:hypothetical protein [Bacteroidota bacterium]
MDIFQSKNIITNNMVENINILLEIRDNAIHFINNDKIKKDLFSICAASIRNYIKVFEKWFPKIKISNYNFFVTPLNFDIYNKEVEPVSLNSTQKQFLKYIDSISNKSDNDDEYELMVNIEVKFIRTDKVDDVILLKYANEGKKVNIELTDEMFNKMYPYVYKQITNKIKNKQDGIKVNKFFYNIMNFMQTNEICCKGRYLDPVNKKGKPKFFYSDGFVGKFLEEYNNRIS